MKKNKSITALLGIIKNACVIYTAVMVVAYCAGALISTEETVFVPDFARMIMILIFSFALSLAGLFLSNKKIPLAFRMLLHFITTAAMFFVVVIIGGGYIESGAQTLIGMVLYAVIYGVFALIYGIVTSKKEKKENKKEKYDSMFN